MSNHYRGSAIDATYRFGSFGQAVAREEDFSNSTVLKR
jgi:hypothetical protein